jgi:hypothetical protein
MQNSMRWQQSSRENGEHPAASGRYEPKKCMQFRLRKKGSATFCEQKVAKKLC